MLPRPTRTVRRALVAGLFALSLSPAVAAQATREQLEAEAFGLPVSFKSIGPHGTPQEIRRRYDEAWVFIKRVDYDAGLRELKWLYAATNGPHANYWRAPLREQIIESLGRLAPYHPATRAFILSEMSRFEALFACGHNRPHEWRAWAELGRAAGDDDRLLRWYEQHRKDDGSIGSAIHSYAQRHVFEILLERRRYADAGRFEGDLVRRAEWKLEFTEWFYPEHGEHYSWEDFQRGHQEDREDLALYHALAIAAGKLDEATGVADVLLQRHDDLASRRALVDAAARIGVDSSALRKWAADLAAAEASDGSQATIAADVTAASTSPASEPPESSGATARSDDGVPSDVTDGPDP